jgi:hypothetical protein
MVTDRPQDWYRVKNNSNGNWVGGWNNIPSFFGSSEYMRIPQWEIDGLKIGDFIKENSTGLVYEIAEFESYGDYENYGIVLTNGVKINGFRFFEFFDKYEPPRTIRIGEYDVPEPLRVKPKGNDYVYVVGLDGVSRRLFEHCTEQQFKDGRIHATDDNAEYHRMALISLSKVKND